LYVRKQSVPFGAASGFWTGDYGPMRFAGKALGSRGCRRNDNAHPQSTADVDNFVGNPRPIRARARKIKAPNELPKNMARIKPCKSTTCTIVKAP
jgi:hypothetical protein